ncbi:M20/M25/M40 family metallo-hydrolase [Glutamicibacter halophytocola]|uniref:M20/M25/M40 family metallo-hydrolase n=1 Tax=Glutamicibacter halophytocola TaxID=1933880 RepID=A0ABX5Y586_9MICC|nr:MULTISPECIES: M20/M25/M40 family metallo-hydrolase [Glutamicibacter]MBF6671689.1 M20/M25/M40 family metallo-hydrolase [Glutamicibacter sp. FBE19]NQD40727.1 M20/M25/M40 family metallo-hydrolase [Glutamicibacter halophytocola]QDY65243.1 M20/M25/M40 family metallo-hydrolase [Glutamicibacter halophytocola]
MTTAIERMEKDAVEICRGLIRIDTTNFGGNKGAGELEAARYVAELFDEVGLDAQIYESAPGRANVVLRIPGSDPSLPALIVHGHLDVVPAIAEDWSVDPFGAEVIDGMIWGRGAVDMKNMDAMIIAAIRHLHREKISPRRDLIIAFFADEEAGGDYGSGWMVQNHPEVFAGAEEAISEVGGFSVDINGRRAYMLQTAEKGIAWLKLTAQGMAGHGSQINSDNAVTTLAGAVHRIGEYQWPLSYTKTTLSLLEQVAELTGLEFDQQNPQPLLEAMGNVSRFVGATLQNTANPSALQAGYKHNVIPGQAEALIDCRTLPDEHEATLEKLAELAGEGVELSMVHEQDSLEVPFAGTLVDTMVKSLLDEDPDAIVLPYMLSGGTDNKWLATIGITGYGFAPLQLPAELDFTGMFHGVDERVPVDAIKFGVKVLENLMRSY